MDKTLLQTYGTCTAVILTFHYSSNITITSTINITSANTTNILQILLLIVNHDTATTNTNITTSAVITLTTIIEYK